jgi:hypothetical protein
MPHAVKTMREFGYLLRNIGVPLTGVGFLLGFVTGPIGWGISVAGLVFALIGCAAINAADDAKKDEDKLNKKP